MMLEPGILTSATMIFVLLASLSLATTVSVGCIIGMLTSKMLLQSQKKSVLFLLATSSRRRRRKEAEKRVNARWLDFWLGSYNRRSSLQGGEYVDKGEVIDTNAHIGS